MQAQITKKQRAKFTLGNPAHSIKSHPGDIVQIKHTAQGAIENAKWLPGESHIQPQVIDGDDGHTLRLVTNGDSITLTIKMGRVLKAKEVVKHQTLVAICDEALAIEA